MLDPKDISTISDMVSGVGNLIQASAWCRIKTALVESQKTPTNTTKATIALLAKCHAEIEIVANRINSLRKLQGEIKAGIAQL